LPTTRQVSRPWAALAIAVLILAVAAFIRLRLAGAPLERDEGEYAYAGQLILQGVPPYQAAYNMKLPGTYAAYAALMAVFGQTADGIHRGMLLVKGGAILFLFLLGRRLFSSRAGLAAGACYALLSACPAVLGTSAHATHFVVLPALAATWLLLRGLESGRMGPVDRPLQLSEERLGLIGGDVPTHVLTLLVVDLLVVGELLADFRVDPGLVGVQDTLRSVDVVAQELADGGTGDGGVGDDLAPDLAGLGVHQGQDGRLGREWVGALCAGLDPHGLDLGVLLGGVLVLLLATDKRLINFHGPAQLVGACC